MGHGSPPRRVADQDTHSTQRKHGLPHQSAASLEHSSTDGPAHAEPRVRSPASKRRRRSAASGIGYPAQRAFVSLSLSLSLSLCASCDDDVHDIRAMRRASKKVDAKAELIEALPNESEGCRHLPGSGSDGAPHGPAWHRCRPCKSPAKALQKPCKSPAKALQAAAKRPVEVAAELPELPQPNDVITWS